MRVAAIGLAVLLFLAQGSWEVEARTKVGTIAPEINAQRWVRAGYEDLSLSKLKGKIVLVEFWATWCPPCRDSIPHLVSLYSRYRDKGVVFIGLTEEDYIRAQVEKFIRRMGINYIVGTGSSSGKKYGITGIPHAFLIGPNGKIVWEGHPMVGLDQALEKAVKKRGRPEGK